MNPDYGNQGSNSNRFIFSNDFYDKLDNSDDSKVSSNSFDTPVISMPQIEKKMVNESNNNVDLGFGNPSSNINDFKQEKDIMNEFNIPKVETNNLVQESDNKAEESVTVVENSSVTDNSDTKSILNDDVNINSSVETILMPEVNIPKVEDNSTVETEINEDKVNVDNLLFSNKSGDEVNQGVSNNSYFNVETGINTDLEKEIMKSRVQTQIKPTIVEDNNWLVKPEEKVAYRAKRTNLVNSNPVRVVESYVERKMVDDTSKVEEEIKSNFYPTPDVINIDELLEKEAYESIKVEVSEEEIADSPATISDLLLTLKQKEQSTGKISILARYGDDFCSRDYITNPAIGREEEIKQLVLILLTPEKSGILVGKPGIGKTSIVEGLAYRLQRNNVPEALKGYRIVSVKTTSLLGTLPNGETRLQTLIDELKELDKIILFIDEIHMLMGATSESSLDFANMFKESLGRGSIKMIGATTTDEYERYVLRDKAFVRRFQRVDVLEPSREHTIKILMGTLPKIEKNTGAKLKYSNYIQTEIMSFIVDITSEYKRVYGIGSRYPDICLTLLSQAFSQAVFDNRKEVNILDIRNAIENSKNIYPDVIRKELVNFDEKFNKIINEEK